MCALVRLRCFNHLMHCHEKGHFGRMILCRCLSTDSGRKKPGIFERVLGIFPDGIHMAFAYGSGVFQQTGHEMSKNMLDFIFVVEDPVQWHTKNLISHRDHYSFISSLGPKTIAWYQEGFGAGVYFNTLVPFEQRLIKYGVVSKHRLVKDLTDWESLYISGRLHKPVRIIKQPSSTDFQVALKTNLKSAIHASLLLLPEKFTEEDLFMKITSLSYSGDFRMKFGEDKGKVRKIVTPNHQHFRDLYQSCLEDEKHIHWNRSLKTFSQDVSSMSRLYHLKHLPKGALIGIQKSVKFVTMGGSAEESFVVLEAVSKMKDCPNIVASSLESIVNHSSWSQSVKSIVTAGVFKSTQYSWKKISKMMKGLTRS